MFKIRNGFSLIELMIVVAIVAILAGIAYPSYFDSVIQSRRADAKTTLLDLAQQIERFYSENHTYANVAASIGGTPQDSPDGWYAISIVSTATTYTLTATPQNSQTNDTYCQTYTYNNLGQEGVTGGATWTAEQCWDR
jgi:type IV pilus assembly protein PilE